MANEGEGKSALTPSPDDASRSLNDDDIEDIDETGCYCGSIPMPPCDWCTGHKEEDEAVTWADDLVAASHRAFLSKDEPLQVREAEAVTEWALLRNDTTLDPETVARGPIEGSLGGLANDRSAHGRPGSADRPVDGTRSFWRETPWETRNRPALTGDRTPGTPAG